MVKVLSQRKPGKWRIFLLAGSFVLLLVVFAGLVRYYNALVVLRQNAITARRQIENAEQYRENMFPLLVEAVVMFVSHEDDVFNYASDKRVDSLRQPRPDKAEIEALAQDVKTDWRAALSKVMAWAENYPDIKTSECFQAMMEKMTEIEREVYDKRVANNEAVNTYVISIRKFPSNTLAFVLGFEAEPYYEIHGELEWRMADTNGPRKVAVDVQ